MKYAMLIFGLLLAGCNAEDINNASRAMGQNLEVAQPTPTPLPASYQWDIEVTGVDNRFSMDLDAWDGEFQTGNVVYSASEAGFLIGAGGVRAYSFRAKSFHGEITYNGGPLNFLEVDIKKDGVFHAHYGVISVGAPFIISHDR